jgi:cell wall-associated NlpC family hydrolase
MKNLFFITISVAAFSLATPCANAQDTTKTNVSDNSARQKKDPKFIENIELNPETQAPNDYSGNEEVVVVKKEPKTPVVEHKIVSVPAENLMKGVSEDAYLENCSALQFKYAILTDREVETIKDTALYHFVDSWIGTPYMYGGSTKDGVDCSSFTCSLLLNIFKLSIPRTAKEQYDACVRVHKNDLKEGDLVFFYTMGKRHGISHVGVYLGNNFFVHSSTSSGVMISNLDEDYFSTRFVSGGRMN